MVDVAADLRTGLVRALGPLDRATMRHSIADAAALAQLREEATVRLARHASEADQSRLLGVRAVILRVLGDFDGAEIDAAAAVKYAEAIGADLLLAPARARLAQVKRVQRHFEEADGLFALAEAGELPRTLTGAARAYAALSCLAQGRVTEALIHLQRASEYNPHNFVMQIVETGLDLAEERAAKGGFGPPPRGWAERAGHPAPDLFKDQPSGRYGYLGPEGRPVVKAAFTQAGDFRGGVAAVRQSDWGAIDKHGTVVVPMLYDSLETPTVDGRNVLGFVGGVAVAGQRGRYGVVHKSGRIVIPPRYQHIAVHPAGFLVSMDGYSWGTAGLDGAEIRPPRMDRAEAARTLDAAVSIDDGPL
ncbi:WG repeat-containing protein [Glycomyces buryatensis]|uniref:WG repeat-containing protein n=1 Tax=Glycomyces buryatensis TaxID=2570927 RepID=A0A4S8QE41_9ACTN|nr:WG repeat-containing protein [Glycomyces buryatensis]THV42600.1 WG repeat-containing protein [Glycomyces buryatensis]